MATWADVRRIALSLPETAEEVSRDGHLEWRVTTKILVWERPLRQRDLAALGDNAPDGPVLAARVADVGVKDALIAEQPDIYFTTPHFNGYPAILARLDELRPPDVTELVTEAWLARAPSRLARAFLQQQTRST